MNDLIKVNYDNADRPTVSGRELHAALEVKTDYPHWFDRMKEYGFTEGEDFQSNLSESTGGRPATDHMVTIPMAKELCMLQRTEKGSFFRKYFIKVLQINVANLTVDNEIMRPKAEYFDELVDRNLLTNIRDTAKELKVKQKDFVNFLLDKKYLYRDKSGKLLPYAKHADSGLFVNTDISDAQRKGNIQVIDSGVERR